MGTSIEHKLLFLKLFRAPRDIKARIPGHPAKKFGFPGFRRTCQTFLAPTPSRGRRPIPLEDIQTKKLGFGFLFSSLTIGSDAQTSTYRQARLHARVSRAPYTMIGSVSGDPCPRYITEEYVIHVGDVFHTNGRGIRTNCRECRFSHRLASRKEAYHPGRSYYTIIP